MPNGSPLMQVTAAEMMRPDALSVIYGVAMDVVTPLQGGAAIAFAR